MKYERHTSGEEFDSIWYYDTDITSNGPVSVVHKWHRTYKQIQVELQQTDNCSILELNIMLNSSVNSPELVVDP